MSKVFQLTEACRDTSFDPFLIVKLLEMNHENTRTRSSDHLGP
jgi:hypothetical protein